MQTPRGAAEQPPRESADLDLDEFELPEEPVVCRIRADFGDPVLEDVVPVWVVFEADTPTEAMYTTENPELKQIRDQIRDYFDENAVGLTPLVRYRTEEEFERDHQGAA